MIAMVATSAWSKLSYISQHTQLVGHNHLHRVLMTVKQRCHPVLRPVAMLICWLDHEILPSSPETTLPDDMISFGPIRTRVRLAMTTNNTPGLEKNVQWGVLWGSWTVTSGPKSLPSPHLTAILRWYSGFSRYSATKAPLDTLFWLSSLHKGLQTLLSKVHCFKYRCRLTDGNVRKVSSM